MGFNSNQVRLTVYEPSTNRMQIESFNSNQVRLTVGRNFHIKVLY